MDSIIALRKHLASIEEIVTSLEESDSKIENTLEIELIQIDKMAKQTPFKGHFISEYDEDIIQRYIIFLASVVRELSDVEKRIKQYFFISRLAHGMPGNIKVSDWITKAELVELADIECIRDTIGNDSVLMAFDILLMISLDGQIEDKQMQYFCEILAYLSIDKKVIDAIVRTCSLILLGEEENVLDFADKIAISKISCYFKNPIIGEAVSSVDGIKKTKNTDVVVVGVGFKNEELDIDKYNKKNIVFKNCKFENIASLRANKTKVRFSNCMFDRCCK